MQIKDLVLKQIKGFWGEESDCEKGIPVIKTNNLSYEGSVDYTDINYREIDREKIKDNYLKKGDLLIEKSGGTKSHSVGYVSYFDGVDCKYVCNNFILCIRSDASKCVSKYLFYQIKYKYENGKFNNCFKQTTGIQNLKVEDYLSKQITYHDLQTQQKIVEELDCLSDIIEKKKQQLADLDNLVKSKFDEMFNNKDFPNKLLKDICIKITDGSHNPPQGINFSEYPMLSSQNINESILFDNVRYLTREDFERENKRTNVSSGDILITIVGTIGRSSIVNNEKITLQRSVAVLKPNKQINSFYLNEFIKSRNAQSQLYNKSHGASQKGVYLSDLKTLKVILPPLEMQNQFAELVENIEKSKNDIKQSIEETQNLMGERMQHYFGE